MIATQGKRDIQTEGVEETVKMSISKSDGVTNHIIKVLTENYLDPIGSHIRESVSNHWDSHLISGDSNKPIFVRIYKNPVGNYTIETEDKGLGMDKDDFDKYYMQLGESSKRGIAQAIGKHGCGAKAALAKVESYEIITRKGGKEWKFLVFKGEEVPERTIIYEKDTVEPNGVIIRVVFDRWEYSDFLSALKKQLCYFKTCVFDIQGDLSLNNSKIYENDLFRWSELYPDSEMHISFGDCYYPISWESLKIDVIDIPIAIRIPIDSGVDIQFNRENLVYNSFSKKYILNKIKEVATWFVNKYNELTPDSRELLKAWDSIGDTTKIVKLAEQEFEINELLQYTNVAPKSLKINGISLKEPDFYKKLDYLEEYECLCDYSDRKWRVKHCKTNHGIHKIQDYPHVLVNKVPTGKLKKYLVEKYRRCYFIKKVKTRQLGKITGYSIGSINYGEILDLDSSPKNTWRSLIKEFQFVENTWKALIKDETQCESTKEYIEWLANEKEIAKANRKSGYSSGNHKVLNKQQGDVTIGYCVQKLVKDSYTRQYGYKFDKTVKKIQELSKNPKLCIYFKEEEKEIAIKLYKLVNTKWDVAILGKNESKKVKRIHNFKNYQEFMESKPFCRIMTSLKIEKELEKYNDLSKSSREIIQDVLNPLQEDINILQEYMNKNGKYVRDSELLDSMIEIAKERDLYDHSLDDVRSRVNNKLKDYSFLNYLKIDGSSEESQKEITTLVHQLMYLKKKMRNEIEDFDIILQPKIKENELKEEVAELV